MLPRSGPGRRACGRFELEAVRIRFAQNIRRVAAQMRHFDLCKIDRQRLRVVFPIMGCHVCVIYVGYEHVRESILHIYFTRAACLHKNDGACFCIITEAN